MKKLYAIVVWNKKDFIELDPKNKYKKIKQIKEINKTNKVKIIEIDDIFIDKKLFLKVINIYLKNMKNSWFVNYFDYNNLQYELWSFNDLYIKYISQNYLDYLNKIDDKLFNTFINKQLFFSIIKSSLENIQKVNILNFYKETYDKIENIKKNIIIKLVSNSIIFVWAIFLYFFLINTLLPKILPLLSSIHTNISNILVFIQHNWMFIILFLFIILFYYLWLFFYNRNTFFKTFSFIKIQYKLFKQINTMQILLLSMLINSLTTKEMKKIISITFEIKENEIKWNSFKEILDFILKEKINLFLPEFILTLKLVDTTDFNSYLNNLKIEIKNLDEEIEQSKELFLWFIKWFIFTISALIAFMWIFSVILVMNSIMTWAWSVLNS